MAVIAPWTEPFLAYLNRKEIPEDPNEARRIVRRSKAYKVHDGELYKKSATGVLQRCISEEEGRQLLAEIHAGLGGHHAAARALVSKAFRTGFYWPTARVDAQDLVQLASDANSSPIKAICPHCPTNNPHHLAFRSLGTRHGWTP